MGTLAENQRLAFASTFNRLVGDKVGRPIQQGISDKEIRSIAPDASDIVKRILQKNAQKVDSTSRSVGSSSSRVTTKKSAVKSKLTEKQKEEFIKARADEATLEADVNSGLLGKISNIVEDSLSNPLKALDVISRPGYAVNEGAKRVAEAINEEEPLWSLTDDFISGLWPGLSGKKKTGFGDVIEEFTKYTGKDGPRAWQQLTPDGTPYVPREMGELDKKYEPRQNEDGSWSSYVDSGRGLLSDNPIHVMKTAGGALGDLGGDPTNLVTAGAVTKFAKGASKLSKAEEGTQAMGAAFRHAIDEAVPDAIKQMKAPTFSPITGMKNGSRLMVEELYDQAYKHADQIMHEIHSGPQAGKVIGTKPGEYERVMAQNIAEDFKKPRLAQHERHRKDMIAYFEKRKSLTAAQVNRMKSVNNETKLWHDVVSQKMHGGKTTLKEATDAADEAVRELIHTEAVEVFSKAFEALTNAVKRVPTIRVGGYRVASLPRLGKVFEGSLQAGKATRLGENFTTNFNYTSNIKGASTLMAAKNKALGNVRFEKLRREVKNLTRSLKLTRQEKQALQRHLEDGVRPTEARMQAGYDFLKNKYEQIFNEELANGIRHSPVVSSAGTPVRNTRVGNYAYLHLKHNSQKMRIEQWVKNRKNFAENTGMLTGFTSKEAAQMGFNFEKDAFKNLLYRGIKQNRKMTRAAFYHDLVTHYGMKGKHIGPAEMAKRKLVKVKEDAILGAKKAPDEHFYIDQDIQDIYNKYNELTNITAQKDAKDFIRGLDFITRKFKTWNTIYFPGYHIKNIISDYFLGWMDGVRTDDYRIIMQKHPRRTTAKLQLGNDTYDYEKLLASYKDNAASSGFLSADIGKTLSAPHAVRRGSELREDLGRFVHFYKAMSEEYPALIKKGYSKQAAYDKAINASLFRVNKYKLDYSALTAFEQKFMRRGVPFYTFIRKMTPTLLESIMLQPRYLERFNNLEEVLTDKDMLLPDWMREIGFMSLDNSEFPVGLTRDLFPTGIINNAFTNPASMAHPALQIPFEMQSDRDMFTEAFIPGSDLEQGVAGIKEALGFPRALDMLGIDFAGKQSDFNWRKITGAPLRAHKEVYKKQAYQDLKQQVENQVRKLDDQAMKQGYHVYFTNTDTTQTFKVRDEVSGEVVFEDQSLKKIREYLEQLT